MFDNSLLEPARGVRRRRGLTTAASLLLQSLFLAALLLLPLFYTDALPLRLWLANGLVSAPPPPAGRPATVHVARATTSEIRDGHLLAPKHIPVSIANVVEEYAPSAGSVMGVPYGAPGGPPDGVLHSVLAPGATVPPSLPAKTPTLRLRVSQGVVEGLLVHQIKPVYPTIAMQTRTQGNVVLHAVIGRDGAISSLRGVSGPPLLVSAAVEAVRQWRYRPYTLNGEAVEVETWITVRFVLGN
jgi:periplasmic protein TonB